MVRKTFNGHMYRNETHDNVLGNKGSVLVPILTSLPISPAWDIFGDRSIILNVKTHKVKSCVWLPYHKRYLNPVQNDILMNSLQSFNELPICANINYISPHISVWEIKLYHKRCVLYWTTLSSPLFWFKMPIKNVWHMSQNVISIKAYFLGLEFFWSIV